MGYYTNLNLKLEILDIKYYLTSLAAFIEDLFSGRYQDNRIACREHAPQDVKSGDLMLPVTIVYNDDIKSYDFVEYLKQFPLTGAADHQKGLFSTFNLTVVATGEVEGDEWGLQIKDSKFFEQDPTIQAFINRPMGSGSLKTLSSLFSDAGKLYFGIDYKRIIDSDPLLAFSQYFQDWYNVSIGVNRHTLDQLGDDFLTLLIEDEYKIENLTINLNEHNSGEIDFEIKEWRFSKLPEFSILRELVIKTKQSSIREYPHIRYKKGTIPRIESLISFAMGPCQWSDEESYNDLLDDLLKSPNLRSLKLEIGTPEKDGFSVSKSIVKEIHDRNIKLTGYGNSIPPRQKDMTTDHGKLDELLKLVEHVKRNDHWLKYHELIVIANTIESEEMFKKFHLEVPTVAYLVMDDIMREGDPSDLMDHANEFSSFEKINRNLHRSQEYQQYIERLKVVFGNDYEFFGKSLFSFFNKRDPTDPDSSIWGFPHFMETMFGKTDRSSGKLNAKLQSFLHEIAKLRVDEKSPHYDLMYILEGLANNQVNNYELEALEYCMKYTIYEEIVWFYETYLDETDGLKHSPSSGKENRTRDYFAPLEPLCKEFLLDLDPRFADSY